MDLSQAELRIVALLANDQAMAEAIMGEDFHADVASSVYGKKIKDVTSAERKKSKGVTFGVLYGGTPAGLSYNTGAPVEEINKILGILFKRFKKLAEWIKREEHLGLQRGHSETIMGRIRDLAELIYSEGSNSARRKIINTPVQATASDTILIIMLVAARELVKRKLRTRPLFGIHDATMFDIFPGEEDPLIDCIKKGFAAIRSTPLGELPLFDTLPIIGELVIGKTWAHCEKTNEAFKPLKEVQFSSLEGN